MYPPPTPPYMRACLWDVRLKRFHCMQLSTCRLLILIFSSRFIMEITLTIRNRQWLEEPCSLFLVFLLVYVQCGAKEIKKIIVACSSRTNVTQKTSFFRRHGKLFMENTIYVLRLFGETYLTNIDLACKI